MSAIIAAMRLFKSKHDDNWTLRKGDLPPEWLQSIAPELREIENNAIFRALVWRERSMGWFHHFFLIHLQPPLSGLGAIVAQPALWLGVFTIVGVFALFQLTLKATAFVFVGLAIIGLLGTFFEGYSRSAETRLVNKSRVHLFLSIPQSLFEELIHSPCTSQDFAQGIWASQARNSMHKRATALWLVLSGLGVLALPAFSANTFASKMMYLLISFGVWHASIGPARSLKPMKHISSAIRGIRDAYELPKNLQSTAPQSFEYLLIAMLLAIVNDATGFNPVFLVVLLVVSVASALLYRRTYVKRAKPIYQAYREEVEHLVTAIRQAETDLPQTRDD